PDRQFCTPHLVTDGKATKLKRISLDDSTISEGWLQRMLFENPTLLPVGEVEPVFGSLIPLARELRTNVGPVDLAFINSDGLLTLVETKLWRNPEARRQAVAQIIDYATA